MIGKNFYQPSSGGRGIEEQALVDIKNIISLNKLEKTRLGSDLGATCAHWVITW